MRARQAPSLEPAKPPTARLAPVKQIFPACDGQVDPAVVVPSGANQSLLRLSCAVTIAVKYKYIVPVLVTKADWEGGKMHPLAGGATALTSTPAALTVGELTELIAK